MLLSTCFNRITLPIVKYEMLRPVRGLGQETKMRNSQVKNRNLLTFVFRIIKSIVLPRSNGYVYICLFVNIEIKTYGWHIQKSGVVFEKYLFSACKVQ